MMRGTTRLQIRGSKKKDRGDVLRHRYVKTDGSDRVYSTKHIAYARRWFLILAFVNSIALLIIISTAIWYTYLNGLPTISHLMATNFTVNTVVAAFILLHILVRTYLIASYTSSAHVFTRLSEQEHPMTKYRLRIYSNVSMLLYFAQVFFLMLIPVIPVTQYPFEHYLCATIGIVASILNETVLLERRRFVHQHIYDEQIKRHVSTFHLNGDDDDDTDDDSVVYKKSTELFEVHFLYARYGLLLAVNALLVLGSIVCACVFAGYLTFHHSIDVTVFTPISFSEYILFYFISLLPAFHVMDIYRPLLLETTGEGEWA